MSHYIGIDIGGTKIVGGIVDDTGKIVTRKDVLTPIQQGGPRILQDSIDLTRELIKSTDKPIKGIGIAAGGQIDSEKGVVYSATDVLPDWRGTRIAEAFVRELDLPTRVENDVNALALGEARFGAAAPLRNGTIVFLLLDAGVGGALLSNGKVHHGASWSGGEFGQILLTMDANARRGTGGGIGTLEAYCSLSGLIQTWHEFSGDKESSPTVRDIFAEAKKDPSGPAAKAITKTGEYLGYGLVSLASTLNPHFIIIGGELGGLGEALLNPAKQILFQRSLTGSATCSVVTANLGPDAAIIGAASLMMLEMGALDTAVTASTAS